MAARCDMCGKGLQFGHNVSHSKQATKRVWRPNLHQVKVQREGRPVKLRVCTRCLRTMRKAE